ncbi:hypothetical protein Tco_1062913 [Tanacetum coccineum]
MAGDDPITSVRILGDGPNDPEPVVNLAGSDDPLTSIRYQSQPEPNLSDPVMHFVVQKFNQINAMYAAFSTKRKEITSQQILDKSLLLISFWIFLTAAADCFSWSATIDCCYLTLPA